MPIPANISETMTVGTATTTATATVTVAAPVPVSGDFNSVYSQNLFVAGDPFPFVRGHADACGSDGRAVSLILVGLATPSFSKLKDV